MKPTDRPNVPCANCSGKGSAPMHDKYWKVLLLLRAKRKLTTNDIQDLSPEGSSETVANKRLEFLRRHGFATRTRQYVKPMWVYSPT